MLKKECLIVMGSLYLERSQNFAHFRRMEIECVSLLLRDNCCPKNEPVLQATIPCPNVCLAW